MTIDLRIRPLGRPNISKDSGAGLQKVTRKYVVEGPKASKAGLDGTYDNVALDLAVGDSDEEFTDHYLVNQQLSPATGMDKAYLVREFLKLRNTWVSESWSESVSGRTLTRRYVVLRKQEDTLGYGNTEWGFHPQSQSGTTPDNKDPWEFVPNLIKRTEPTLGYSKQDVLDALNSYPKNDWSSTSPDNRPSVKDSQGNSVALHAALTSSLDEASGHLNWVRAGAQVDTSNPGIDIWNVSWKLPGLPSWSVAGSTKGSSWKAPNWISFDHNGFRVNQAGGSGGGALNFTQYTFTFFYVGSSPPALVTGGYGANPGAIPAVSFDFYFTPIDGVKRSLTFKNTFKNSVFLLSVNIASKLEFPNPQWLEDKTHPDAGMIAVTEGQSGNELIFNFDSALQVPDSLPHFQRMPIQTTGGKISWTFGFDEGSSAAQMVGASAKPIHRHKGNKIWQVELTYR